MTTSRYKLLPGTGKGTSEAGGGGVPRNATLVEQDNPLHHPADGPPPRAGEDWL